MPSHLIFTTTLFRDENWRLAIQRHPSHDSESAQHSHDFHELIIIVDGHGKHAVGNEIYELKAGDVFVVLGDTTHGYPETRNLYLINILFDPDNLGIPRADIGSLPGYHALFTIEPTMRQQTKFKNKLRLSTDQLGQATRLVAEVEDELRGKTRGHRFVATAHLMRLVAYLSRCYSQLQMDERRPVTQISQLLGYMERHSAEPITVADLLKVAHMSQTSLMRTFRQVLGRSPIDYLISLRISQARRLLRSTDIPITNIAMEVGFTDSNYFARQFRRIVGMSPREFRRQNE